MKKFTIEQIEKKVYNSIDCDKCGKSYAIVNGGCKEVCHVFYNLGEPVELDICGECIEKIKGVKDGKSI